MMIGSNGPHKAEVDFKNMTGSGGGCALVSFA
jgi:hypothetical protein